MKGSEFKKIDTKCKLHGLWVTLRVRYRKHALCLPFCFRTARPPLAI